MGFVINVIENVDEAFKEVRNSLTFSEYEIAFY